MPHGERLRLSLEGAIAGCRIYIYIYVCLCVCVYVCVYVCGFVRDGHLLSELAIIDFRPGAEV